MTLSNLKRGDRAVITDIRTPDPRAVARLAARGVVPGTEICVVHSGDPLLIGIDNDRWALNRIEASGIYVEMLKPNARGLRALLRRIA